MESRGGGRKVELGGVVNVMVNRVRRKWRGEEGHFGGARKRTESERKGKRPGLSDRLDTPEGRKLRIGRDDLRLDGS